LTCFNSNNWHNQLILLETTPYYHTISRCVRRAFLCGEDSLTGKNCKQWVLTRLQALSEVFAIDICAYVICKGRFWEGRFKSQALLDEAAVLTCMSYVDLNPVRAGIAETPEASDFTSIQQRIRQHLGEVRQKRPAPGKAQAVPLMPLVKQQKDPHCNAIGFTLRDYLQLIDWAGRAVRDGKRGAISEDAPPILQRIGLEPGRFLEHLQGHGATEEQTAMGHLQRIRQAAEALGRRFLKGGGEARRLYVTGAIG
jgi:hypothetical protein